MVKIEKIDFMGLTDTLRIYNGAAELLIPTQLGFRVLSYRLEKGENLFKLFPEQIANKDRKRWQPFGGHRLWHAPEADPRTYEVDGAPLLSYELTDGGVTLTQATDSVSHVSKRVTARLDEKTSEVTLTHTLTNEGAWDIETAAWALTVFKEGGYCAVETPENDFSLLPDRSLTLWPYARMNDQRVYWGGRVISVRHAAADTPFKCGIFAAAGKAAYVNGDTVFTKTFSAEDADYPDGNCNFECYTNRDIEECESLSPLALLEPGDSIEHTEVWTLRRCKNSPASDDEQGILQLLRE